MMQFRQLAVVFAALSFLTGCAGHKPYHIALMPPPMIYHDEMVKLIDDAQRVTDSPDLEVLYATNRRPRPDTTAPESQLAYTGERDYLLHLGLASVKIDDPSTTWADLQDLSILKSSPAHYPLQVDRVEPLGEINYSRLENSSMQTALQDHAPAFITELKSRMARAKRKEIFIYVHGFRVNFDNPVIVASEIHHYLGREGVMLAFSWPSTENLLGYITDIETTAFASRDLMILLEYLALIPEIKRINLISYSAGNRVAARALRDLRIMHFHDDAETLRQRLRIGNVKLVSADVDRDIFYHYLEDGLLDVMERLTIYASDKDQALHMAERIFRHHKRIGEAKEFADGISVEAELLRQQENFALVNVTEVPGVDEGNGHHYFISNPWVSSDIFLSLRYDMPTHQRGLTWVDDHVAWYFPEDYPRVIKKVFAAKPLLEFD